MTKAELQSYKHIKREIREIESTMCEMNTRLYYPRVPKLTGMPTAPSTEQGSAQERAATALFELREKYNAAIEQLYRKAAIIETAIELVEDPMQRRILRLRYIDGRSWRAIGARVHLAEASLYRIHGEAILSISKI